MDKIEPVIKETTLDAPVSRVWQAITDKEQISKWFMKTDDFEPVAGCRFTLTDIKDGHEYPSKGTVIEVETEKKLSFTWMGEDDPAEDLVTIELSELGNKTKLKLTHSGLLYLTVQDKITRDNILQGWHQMLDINLKSLVENN